MSEKGGKMFSMPQKKSSKSSLKSSSGKDAPLKGKGDSSGKGKAGRKVQFDEDIADANLNSSSKYGGKDAPMFPRGKGDNTSSGGKASRTKTPEPLELKTGNDIPKNAKCLMAGEAAEILQAIQEQMIFLSKDPSIKSPISFDKGLQYAKRGSHYENPKAVRKVLETLAKHGVTEAEMCMIADICPDSSDEVFSLVPSLKAKKRVLKEPIEEVLSDLSDLKHESSDL